MTENDIPKPWRNALKAIQVMYPEAVIAGGALRDREQGVKVKDIDIFVPSRSNQSMEQTRNVMEVLKREGWEDAQINNDKSYSDCSRGISGVIDTTFPGCPAIQIIVTTLTIKEMIDSFDFGVCQISFDGKTIRRTKHYMTDCITNQFRLIPKMNDVDFVRSLNRWARLKQKYPEWTLNLGSRAED